MNIGHSLQIHYSCYTDDKESQYANRALKIGRKGDWKGENFTAKTRHLCCPCMLLLLSDYIPQCLERLGDYIPQCLERLGMRLIGSRYDNRCQGLKKSTESTYFSVALHTDSYRKSALLRQNDHHSNHFQKIQILRNVEHDSRRKSHTKCYKSK